MQVEEIQFGAMMVTALLTLTLVAQVPRYVSSTVNRARWLMVGSITLLFLQFLLQYIYGFRAQGIRQGVAVNLLFFIPSSFMMTLALLYLERQGSTPKSAWIVGGLSWFITIVLLTASVDFYIVDGRLLLHSTALLMPAEYIAALCFCGTQIWFYNLHYKEHRKLKKALDNFNDDDTNELLQWMHNSVMMLSAAALFVPVVIFLSGAILGLYSFLFFGTFYYCIICFYRYSVSTTPDLVEEAQREEEDYIRAKEEENSHTEETMAMKAEISEAVVRHVEAAVSKWTEQKGYLHKKATLQRVADEMNVSRNQLSVWLRATGRMFNPWINSLRIEEAKQLLREHNDWSNDNIAEICGFGSRSYFQTVFKENTGMTPAQFVAVIES